MLAAMDPGRLCARNREYAPSTACPSCFLETCRRRREIHRLLKNSWIFSRSTCLITMRRDVADREVTPGAWRRPSPLITLAPLLSLTLCSPSFARRPPGECYSRPRVFPIGTRIFPISRGSGDLTGWSPTTRRSSATFLFTYELARLLAEHGYPRAALEPRNPRLRAWAITCGVYCVFPWS